MQTELRLVVPESERSKAVIEEYYAYLETKFREGEYERDLKPIELHRDRALARVTDEDRFVIRERIHPDARRVDEYHQLFDLLEECDYVSFDRQMIERVRTNLRTVKRAIVSERLFDRGRNGQTEDEVEYQFEIGPIAVCEFALEHEFGIELVY